MERTSEKYSTYLQILQKELIPALGCTDPIAVAYCAAIARKTLGCLPEWVDIEASGNIIKNVKSVLALIEKNGQILFEDEPVNPAAESGLDYHNWFFKIINSMDAPWTNGFIEGCNNKTKVLKRVCYGMRNFRNFRNRILFCNT